jgi:outer membrane protein assembly factor BamB
MHRDFARRCQSLLLDIRSNTNSSETACPTGSPELPDRGEAGFTGQAGWFSGHRELPYQVDAGFTGPTDQFSSHRNDGSIYTATFGGAIYALDSSGEVRWTYHVDPHEIPSALMRDAEDNLYFTTNAKVFSLTASGGKRWETDCAPLNPFPRVVQEGALTRDTVFTTCGENFAALDTADGRELWKVPYTFFQYNTTPVVLRSGAIVLPEDQRLAAVDRNGNSLVELPAAKVHQSKAAPCLVARSNVFFVCHRGRSRRESVLGFRRRRVLLFQRGRCAQLDL